MRILAALAILIGLQSAPPVLGGRLKAGMQLHYASNGVETPWLVVSTRADTVDEAGRRCLSVRLRMSPADTNTVSRIQCREGDRMYAWSPSSRAMLPARPIGQGVLEMRPTATGQAKYTAGPLEVDTIGGQGYVVVPTVVETLDPSGRVVRRLRERFAIELATATCGVFELAEGTGFRVERAFTLAAITNPGEIRAPSTTPPSTTPSQSRC
jgi:hypothetical protein